MTLQFIDSFLNKHKTFQEILKKNYKAAKMAKGMFQCCENLTLVEFYSITINEITYGHSIGTALHHFAN